MNTTATLSCASSGDAPLSYQWRFNGNKLTDNARISGAMTDTLTISHLVETDNGTYTCTASNAHGDDTAQASLIVISECSLDTILFINTVVLFVIYLGLPRSPETVSINSIGSLVATVRWSIITDTLNHPIDYVYINYHRKSDSSHVTSLRVPSTISQLTLDGLYAHTDYVVRVIANNIAGNSTETRSHHSFKTAVGGT